MCGVAAGVKQRSFVRLCDDATSMFHHLSAVLQIVRIVGMARGIYMFQTRSGSECAVLSVLSACCGNVERVEGVLRKC